MQHGFLNVNTVCARVKFSLFQHKVLIEPLCCQTQRANLVNAWRHLSVVKLMQTAPAVSFSRGCKQCCTIQVSTGLRNTWLGLMWLEELHKFGESGVLNECDSLQLTVLATTVCFLSVTAVASFHHFAAQMYHVTLHDCSWGGWSNLIVGDTWNHSTPQTSLQQASKLVSYG